VSDAGPTLTVNHIGLCVSDLERTRAFYEHALGFTYERSLQPPDPVTATLLGVVEPVGLTAVYLTHGTFVLELLHYERPGNPPGATRVMNEPGFTHLSFNTTDLQATLARVREHGGEVVDSTDVSVAIMIRDPDGQLLELIRSR